MDPRDKVALITGGARIGRTVAQELARRGCHVALTYRGSRASAEETAAAVEALGARGLAVQADLEDEQAVGAAVDAVRARLGRLDILVLMASLYEKRPFGALDAPVWRSNLDANLRSAYLLALKAAPLMKAQGGGRVVTFADWLPVSGRPRYRGYLPYYVSKAGVIGLTESLALELAPEILVNAVAPGPILKPPGFSDKADRQVRKVTPLGRWGGPAEIAKAVLFLIDTEFVTGECLRVDGGRHLY
ncbi:MAG TPA: SDR family oxidoreductase [Candidatus Polarisedimenticolia bacterium]|nr:SDR family oxidoreductase [Candidatus Polarisedimenticolia bacterium]